MADQVIITGANGLVGSYVSTQLSPKFELVSFDISDPQDPVDITNKDVVMAAVGKSSAKYLIHFAAFTDVTAAWEQANDKNGVVYKVNVLGTQNLVNACNEHGKHLIHTSTSYVFDGEKETPYTEEDELSPIEWYGETKALAEQYITRHAKDWTILRIDQPFRPDKFARLDLPHKIIEQLQAGSLMPQFTDHYFGPTWIPDFSKTIEWVMTHQKHGLYNASNGESWTNYDYAVAIAKKVGSNIEVQGSSLAEYLKKQQRPYQKNTALDCSKLQSELDFTPATIADAIQQLEY